MHAVALSRGIHMCRTRDRTAKKGWFFSSDSIDPNEYPKILRKGELGYGYWPGDKKGVAHGSWRGTGFDDKYQAFFQRGKKYRVPGLLATALDKTKAIDFIFNATTKARVLWCIKVDGRGIKRREHRVMHASFVQKSLICDGNFKPTETEFLYAAYSAFEVEDVKWATPGTNGNYKIGTFHQIVIRAANDNQDTDEWPEDLDL